MHREKSRENSGFDIKISPDMDAANENYSSSLDVVKTGIILGK